MISRMTKLLAPLLFYSLVSAAAAEDKCSVAAIQALTPSDATIDSARRVLSPVSHCEVVGHIITQNPGPNRVEFTVMLPDERFLGRYYFIGEGAAAGFVPTTDNSYIMNHYYVNTTVQLLNQGFAVAGTDTGHKGMMWDFMIDNPAAKYDHGHRGAHVSAVATQAITRAYYAMDEKLYRYHVGCSGGGRMGAMAVMHHPEDYDGVVISTGFGRGNSMWFPWILQELIRNPDSWVSPAKLAVLEDAVTAHCAGPDGLIRDPDSCGFEPETLLCQSGDKADCLTKAELSMVKRVTGRHPVAPGITSGGFSLAMPTAWTSFLLGSNRPTNTNPDNPWAPNPPPSAYGIAQSILRGVYFNDADFNFVSDLDFNNPQHLQTLEDHHADWGALGDDLSAYKKAGGKIILWAGLAENAVPPATEIEYYHQMKKTTKGVDDFIRLYLVPGVLHCSGGPGPQDAPERFLDEVIDWVEQGNRPNEIVAHATANKAIPVKPGQPPVLMPPTLSRSVLLCPYPKEAKFTAKKGAFPFDADNWSCR